MTDALAALVVLCLAAVPAGTETILNGRTLTEGYVGEQLTTATIADDGNLSAAVEIPYGYRLAAIVMPSTWDTATLTFTVSTTAGGTYTQLYYDGNVYTLSEAAASRNITVNPVALYPWRYIKIQSGTVASAVSQTTGTTRVFTLVLRPY